MANVFINESTMTDIGNAIRSKTGKTDMILPQNMAKEIEGIKTGEDKELLNKVINKTVTDIYIDTDIGGYAFYSCGRINPTFGSNCKIIYEYAFQNCGYLAEVQTNKVTLLRSNVFMGLPRLIKADLPSVEQIMHSCFRNCINLDTVIIRTSTLCSLSSNTVFDNTKITKGTGYIYVPKTLIEQYKVATNWVTYASQFRAIEDYPEITGGV